MKVKEESEKAGLKLNIPIMKIMASSPINSWQIWKWWNTLFFFRGWGAPCVKSQLIGKEPDAGKDWRQEKGVIWWDGWMPSLTQWTWVWTNSGRWWRTGKAGMLQFTGSKRVGHSWMTEQQFKSYFGLPSKMKTYWPDMNIPPKNGHHLILVLSHMANLSILVVSMNFP